MQQAFEFFGCVPREVWWDNPKTVAEELQSGRDRKLNPRYAAFASHYAFEPLFCMPASGNEKPVVENRVKTLQRRWGTPLAVSECSGRKVCLAFFKVAVFCILTAVVSVLECFGCCSCDAVKRLIPGGAVTEQGGMGASAAFAGTRDTAAGDSRFRRTREGNLPCVVHDLNAVKAEDRRPFLGRVTAWCSSG
jgi:hypothetical protein